MTTDDNIILCVRTPLAGFHPIIGPCRSYEKHRFRHTVVEFAVQKLDELLGSGLSELAIGGESIDDCLYAHVRRSFELEIASRFVRIQVADQSALDIPRARVLPLDEVTIIGIHDADEAGEACRRTRMEGVAKRGCRGSELGSQVGELGRHGFEARRFDSLNGFRP